MFAVFNWSTEKSIIKLLLKKGNPTVGNKFLLVYRLVYISDSMDEYRQLTIKNIVVSSW